jgi:hypothetical protein
MPRTFVWMVIFDFPAVLAAAPFGIADAPLSRPPFLLFAGFFWYWCGRGLERRLTRVNETRSRPGIVASVLNGVGLICALALEISVLWSPGGTGLVFLAAVVGWCTAFAVYFGARLARRWASGYLASAGENGLTLINALTVKSTPIPLSGSMQRQCSRNLETCFKYCHD